MSTKSGPDKVSAISIPKVFEPILINYSRKEVN